MAMYNPPHPGEFIQEVYLKPFHLTIKAVANQLQISPAKLGRVLNRQIRLTPDLALRLSKVLGRSPESWLAMQDNYDLWNARATIDLEGLERLALPTV